MNKIFEEAWITLKNNYRLYYAPIIIFLITLFINPIALGTSISSTLSFIAMSLISLALHTGWLNQIFTVLKQKREANFDDILIGIGKYFLKVLNIYLILFTLTLITFILFSSIVEKYININQGDLELILNKFKNLKEINQENVISIINTIPSKTLSNLHYLANYTVIYVLIISTIYFFISLWNYILIYKESVSYKSIILSFKLVSKKIFSFTFLSFADFIFSFLIILFIFNSNNELLLFLLLISKILTQTFFTIAFCIFVDKNLGNGLD